MFTVFYKSFKSSANIYSIDKFKDLTDKTKWLIVTSKEIYTLCGDEEGNVVFEQVHDHNQLPENDNVSCKTFNLASKSEPKIRETANFETTPFIWVIAQQSKIEEKLMSNKPPTIFNLNIYANGDLSNKLKYGLDYAPYKMAYFEFESNNYLIVSGNDAQLHIYKIDYDEKNNKLTIEDAKPKFFQNGKCEFDSDVLHIHVEFIDSNHCLIAIATEFGQIKFFEVKNKQKKSGFARSEFREFFSGNISSNICKIQLFLTTKEQDDLLKSTINDLKNIQIDRSADKKNQDLITGKRLEDGDAPIVENRKRRKSLTYSSSQLIQKEQKEAQPDMKKQQSFHLKRQRSQDLNKKKIHDAMYNPQSNIEMNLLVTTNYGYSIIYHDITQNKFEQLSILPLLKNKSDLATACEVLDFDLLPEKESFNIILGLYSHYLVRYSEKKKVNTTHKEDGNANIQYEIRDALLLDYPIMAISKGDIFDIGIYYMIVVTAKSVWVVGPKIIDKIIGQLT